MKISKIAKSVKTSGEAAETVNSMDEIVESKKCNIWWLAYQQDQIFEKFKMNDKFIHILFKIHTIQNINCKISKKNIQERKIVHFLFIF